MDNGGEISGDLGVVDGSGDGFLVQTDAEEELHRFIVIGSYGAETDGKGNWLGAIEPEIDPRGESKEEEEKAKSQHVYLRDDSYCHNLRGVSCFNCFFFLFLLIIISSKTP